MTTLSTEWIAVFGLIGAAVIAATASIAAQVVAKRREHRTATELKVMDIALALRAQDIQQKQFRVQGIMPIELHMAYVRRCAQLAGAPALDAAEIAKLGADMEALAKLIAARNEVGLPPADPASGDVGILGGIR